MVDHNRKVYHMVFIMALVCLTILKWNDLGLPFFWDELGVYARAADYQVQHGIGLLPASLTPELSRGHPLLFTYLNALVWRVFGEHVFVAHLFCFFSSLLLLSAIYLKTARYFNPLTALVCTGICMIQPLFIAQSGLVIPEIILALFSFMALCSFYEDRYFLFAFFASLGILTKESAIVLPAIVFFYAAVQWVLMKERPRAFKLWGGVLLATPYLVFGCFLLLQKQQNGWYFFPYHMESISFNPHEYYQQLLRFMSFVFVMQGRFVLTIITVISILLLLLKNGRIFTGGGFLPLLIVSSIAFIAFNSFFGVYMGRYVTVVVVMFSVMAGIVITRVCANRVFLIVAMAGLLLVGLLNLESDTFSYDEDMSYRREVHVLQQGVDQLVKIAKPGEKVFGNFPAYFALGFSGGGYLHGMKIDSARLDGKGDHYLLLCDPGGDCNMDATKYSMELLNVFVDGTNHVSLYRVSKKSE